MKRGIVIFILALLLCVLGGYFYLHRQKPIPVEVIALQRQSITSTLNATGKVVSRQQAEISPSLSATMKEIYVDEGDKVAAGALLARLDNPELMEKAKEAHESLLLAQVKLRQSKRDYESLKLVYSVGGTSRQSVDDAHSALKMAQTETNKARQGLKIGQLMLEKLQLKAPFAGIITKRNINTGEWASSGHPILSLATMTSLAIDIMVDGSDDSLVKLGQTVELSSDAYPDRTWKEHVVDISPALKKEDTADSVRVRVSYGAQAPALKLGQQIDAKIQTAHRNNTLKVPFNCLVTREGEPYLILVKDNQIHYVHVVTGIEDMTSVEIVKGVSVGDQVVVPEGNRLKDGDQVKIRPVKVPR